jgi:mRNA interferase RelE/StbE
MTYRVELKPSAATQVKKLEQSIQRRVLAKFRQLAENPRPSGVQKLQGPDDFYRVRVGDFRIIYSILDDELIVLILSVADRKDAYR